MISGTSDDAPLMMLPLGHRKPVFLLWPVETARNGILRGGSHSKYGFGERRVKPVKPREEAPTEEVIENSAKV